jgi:hypothetical protein
MWVIAGTTIIAGVDPGSPSLTTPRTTPFGTSGLNKRRDDLSGDLLLERRKAIRLGRHVEDRG